MLQKINFCCVLVFLTLSNDLRAAPECRSEIAKVVSIQGQVEIQHAGANDWQAAREDDIFCPGDKVRTAKWSRSTLVLNNQAIVTLDQNTTLIFPETELKREKASSPWLLNLLQGASFFRSRETQRLNIQTPFINAVHEGTEFLVSVSRQKTEISVFDGLVSGISNNGNIQITKGYKGIAAADRPPQLEALKISPEDAVQWSLFYPPLLDNHGLQLLYPETSPGIVQAYEQGKIHQALALLAAIPPPQRNSRHFIIQAGLLLSVGRVDEAQTALLQVLHNDPAASDVYALQAVIAVTKNRQASALAFAQKAAAISPKSSLAKIALSYAQQSLFNLESALQAVQQALKLNPNHALAWARLSELQLSVGNHDSALAAAEKARTLNPKLARTQTVLGFAHLAQMKSAAALLAFEQAIELDSSDPLPRLGFGLCQISQGLLKKGVQQLEAAVNLDPTNALTRSYLGKAYYELRNSDYANTEFNLAKVSDPKDPTPWFYGAILKQTTNQPVAALHDMQKAIELNDNRGVYRSNLLLDQDLAARSAGLGRIYTDLGFQRLGLVQGWKSVNIDPADFSAHRLLADTYSSQPRHEIARVSELLQSQLLQPINLTPVQPQLAQSNILIVDGLGPSSLSYNEFNPLFTRNRFALQASGIYGSHNTWGEDVVHSGVWDKASYSLGQFHYETQGYRKHNFVDQDIYNAFLQGNITDALSMQAEYRHEERLNGNLSVDFNDPNDPDRPIEEITENRFLDTYRIGGRHQFSPNSSLTASLIYQEARFQTENPRVDLTKVQRNGFISELQHQYIKPLFKSITGFSYLDQRSRIEITPLDLIPEEAMPIRDGQDLTRTHLYNYSHVQLTNQLKTTLGLSYDTYHFASDVSARRGLNKNPLSPKLGLIWNPAQRTTLRAALFRTLNVTRTANQTIEPTQVAGFNQFFDDVNGTIAWRYGGAIDQVFSNDFAAGVEYSERKLDVPSSGRIFNWSEQLARAYLYATPAAPLSLSLEYFYERFDKDVSPFSGANPSQGVLDVTTHWLPLTINYFHPSGLSLMVKSTYVNQSGLFEKNGMPFRGHSDFFLFDINLNYRLPARYGMLSFGIKNLFNNRFDYQSTSQTSDSNEILFAPEMTLFTRLKLAF
jgi:tetratricopeptide (TPR) repeat protein